MTTLGARSNLHRRDWLAVALLGATGAAQASTPKRGKTDFAPAPLQFPRDLGSHPDTAIEWWYITGQLQAGAREFGFQITFFRSRVPSTQGMTSRFAAKQLIFAHAAVTDVAGQKLHHGQRVARASGHSEVDLASASTQDTALSLGNWSLQRQGNSYQARTQGDGFAFELTLLETQPMLLQGVQGWSRKGPDPRHGSMYYSLPQLQTTGQLTLNGTTLPVRGQAWLDHEWSHALLAPQAVGWDWVGMNLQDGSALTAFQLRTASGQVLWAGGSWRPQGVVQAQVFEASAVRFTPQRRWTSPTSGATYPVQWALEVTLAAAQRVLRFTVRAVVDAQELDSRQSTGAMYWEGLSDLLDPQGQRVGRGYLEMTGYASPLAL